MGCCPSFTYSRVEREFSVSRVSEIPLSPKGAAGAPRAAAATSGAAGAASEDLGLGLGGMEDIASWCKDPTKTDLSPQHLMNMLCMSPPLSEAQAIEVLTREYKFQHFWPSSVLYPVDTNTIHLGQILYACGVFQGLDFCFRCTAEDEKGILTLMEPLSKEAEAAKGLRPLFFAVKHNHFPILGEVRILVDEEREEDDDLLHWHLEIMLCNMGEFMDGLAEDQDELIPKTIEAVKHLFKDYKVIDSNSIRHAKRDATQVDLIRQPQQSDYYDVESSEARRYRVGADDFHVLLAAAISWRCMDNVGAPRNLAHCLSPTHENSLLFKCTWDAKARLAVNRNMSYLLNFAAVACGPWVSDHGLLKSDKELRPDLMKRCLSVAAKKFQCPFSELCGVVRIMGCLAWRLQYVHKLELLRQDQMSQIITVCLTEAVRNSNPLFLVTERSKSFRFEFGMKLLLMFKPLLTQHELSMSMPANARNIFAFYNQVYLQLLL